MTNGGAGDGGAGGGEEAPSASAEPPHDGNNAQAPNDAPPYCETSPSGRFGRVRGGGRRRVRRSVHACCGQP